MYGLMDVAEGLDGLADQTLREVLSGDIAADSDGLAAWEVSAIAPQGTDRSP